MNECIKDPDIEAVLTVGRTLTGISHPKLYEIIQPDVSDLSLIEPQLNGFDVCIFCIGISSALISDDAYEATTYDLAVSVGNCLALLNPQMTFIYISAHGADSTEKTPIIWARVKGKTENALRKLPFNAVYVFRPSMIQPLNNIHSRTRMYRLLYGLLKPILPFLHRHFPKYVTTTQELAQAILMVAKQGYDQPIIETGAFATLAKAYQSQPIKALAEDNHL